MHDRSMVVRVFHCRLRWGAHRVPQGVVAQAAGGARDAAEQREVLEEGAVQARPSRLHTCTCMVHLLPEYLLKVESLTPSAPGRASGVNKATGFPIP